MKENFDKPENTKTEIQEKDSQKVNTNSDDASASIQGKKLMQHKDYVEKVIQSQYDDPNEPKYNPKLTPSENKKVKDDYDQQEIIKQGQEETEQRLAYQERMEKTKQLESEAAKFGQASIKGEAIIDDEEEE